MLQMPFWLPPGDSIILKVKANGSTWRIIAQQELGFPQGFFSTVALEGCHEGVNFSTGFVNQFPSGDAAPWLDEECRVVTGSYDPNDKSAVPEGYGEQHFVAANTDLEYLIRFQNTGADTAFRVVVRDRISPYLDPASEVAYISFKDNALSSRKLSLYDLSGRLAAVAFSPENTVAVQCGKLPTGMYLVKIETAGKRMQVGAVVWR